MLPKVKQLLQFVAVLKLQLCGALSSLVCSRLSGDVYLWLPQWLCIHHNIVVIMVSNSLCGSVVVVVVLYSPCS